MIKIGELKSITLPAVKSTYWTSLFGLCTKTYSLYDLLETYASNTFISNIYTNATLTGKGTQALPLKIAQQGATNNQVLTWTGSTWAPATPAQQVLSYTSGVFSLSLGGGTVNVSSLISTDTPNLLSTGSDLNLKVSIYKDSTISGNGTSGSPLSIAPQGATSGQVLTYNGSTWVPTTVSGSITNGTALGQVLYWNGSNWIAATPKKDVQVVNSGSQVTLPFSPITTLITDVYLNGLLQESGVDYTIAANVITFAFSFTTNDKITTKYYA